VQFDHTRIGDWQVEMNLWKTCAGPVTMVGRYSDHERPVFYPWWDRTSVLVFKHNPANLQSPRNHSKTWLGYLFGRVSPAVAGYSYIGRASWDPGAIFA